MNNGYRIGYTRRKAIAKTLAGIVGAAAIAGIGGYLVASSMGAVTRTVTAQQGVQTVTKTLLTTIKEVTTVTEQPKLRTVNIRFVNTQGGRGTAPNSLVHENKKEFAEKHSINFNYNIVEGTGAAVKELVEGRADIIGPATVAGIAAAMEQNPQIKIIYFVDIGVYTTFLVGPNSPYRSLNDLREAVRQGKKIRVAYSRPGSLSYTYTVVLAHILGTKLGEGIEGVALGAIDAIVAATVRGEVDGFPWTPDVHWRLEEEGKGRVIYSFSEYFGSKWHELCFATTEQIIKNNPEMISRFVNYWRDVTRYYLLNREEVIALMMAQPPKGFGMSRNVAEKYYSTYLVNYLGAPIREALANVEYFAKLTGVAKNPPPIEQWYTTQFL